MIASCINLEINKSGFFEIKSATDQGLALITPRILYHSVQLARFTIKKKGHDGFSTVKI